MAVVTNLSGLQLNFSTEFYQLLRGFLEKNLGDQLVPIPETIPLEILQKPISSCVSNGIHVICMIYLLFSFFFFFVIVRGNEW